MTACIQLVSGRVRLKGNSECGNWKRCKFKARLHHLPILNLRHNPTASFLHPFPSRTPSSLFTDGLRLRPSVKGFAFNHLVHQWQRKDLDPGLLTPHPQVGRGWH